MHTVDLNDEIRRLIPQIEVAAQRKAAAIGRAHLTGYFLDAALLALAYAARAYDPSRNTQFSTLAWTAVIRKLKHQTAWALCTKNHEILKACSFGGLSTEGEEWQGPADPETAADWPLLSQEFDEDQIAAFQVLTPLQRQIMVWRYFEDRPVAEIAASLSFTAGKVRDIIFRARRLLRAQLAA